jgi:hypothetical protein
MRSGDASARDRAVCFSPACDAGVTRATPDRVARRFARIDAPRATRAGLPRARGDPDRDPPTRPPSSGRDARSRITHDPLFGDPDGTERLYLYCASPVVDLIYSLRVAKPSILGVSPPALTLPVWGVLSSPFRGSLFATQDRLLRGLRGYTHASTGASLLSWARGARRASERVGEQARVREASERTHKARIRGRSRCQSPDGRGVEGGPARVGTRAGACARRYW